LFLTVNESSAGVLDDGASLAEVSAEVLDDGASLAEVSAVVLDDGASLTEGSAGVLDNGASRQHNKIIRQTTVCRSKIFSRVEYFALIITNI
jgi:hypothetical protein